ncbi:MAG: carbohydrate ABC transporter permease [Trueperaceae bacterium]|nr:MAG: carbohydrate ABC transporter permease [Trueperaceae bacterium]
MRLRAGPLFRHGVLMSAVLITLLPIVFTAFTSFKFRRDIISGRFFDFERTLVNYERLFEGSRAVFGQLTVNSLIAGIGSTLLVLFIASLGAYTLSRFRWPKRVSALILGWLLFVYMLPPITFAGPFYLIARQIGLFDTPAVLVIAHSVLTLPFAVWLLQSFFAEIPRELEEAASLDGCSRAGTFWRVALPITLPGLYATAILTFVFSWKDFLFALVLTSTPRGGTIPIGIASFVQEWDLRYGEMAAATMLAAIPAIILVLFAQRHIIKGMTMGAVKG